MLLRFGLADYVTNSEDNNINPAVASNGKFMAVYDKKMLDRANMYIDERVDPVTGDPTNVIDWNDISQIQISPFTYFRYDGDQSTNMPTYGSVAYSYYDHDSVEEYNNYLDQQLNLIQWYYGANNTRWTETNPNPNPEWSMWNNTLAPGGLWENYLGGSDFENLPQVINGVMHYPYQPGYSLWVFRNRRDISRIMYDIPVDQVLALPADQRGAHIVQNWTVVDTNVDFNNLNNRINELRATLSGNDNVRSDFSSSNTSGAVYSSYSAGIDCVGLIMRSASYENNPYVTINGATSTSFDINAWPWGNTASQNGRRSLVTEEDTNRAYYNLWRISGRNNPVNLDKVIPGDIMYYWDGANYHVTMVNKVVYVNNGRTPTIDNIQLIESTWGRDRSERLFGRIINFKYIDDYSNQSWIIGRLITSN